MAVTIENTSGRRLLLRFNSGLTRHLAPGEKLEAVDRVEIKANAWLSHLEDRGAVAVRSAQDDRNQAAGGRLQSKNMREKEALAHIQRTPVADLHDFDAGEDRAKVLRALEEKRSGR